MSQTDSTLDKLYNENVGYTKLCFETYRKIYSLETITHKETVSKTQMDYIKRKDFFVLLVLYNNEGQVFLRRNVQDNLYWELSGRGIEPEESIFDVISSIAQSISQKIKIGDVEPIAFIENIFSYKNTVFTHHGLAFAARVRNENELLAPSVKGMFIEHDLSEIEKINRPVNKKVVEYFFTRYKHILELDNLDFQDTEVTTNENYKARYLIHNNFVKRFILTNRRKRKDELKKQIIVHIGNASSILDISCGDDEFILELAKEHSQQFKYIVGNDISWSQIEIIDRKRDKNSPILFTNHNAVFCPFAENSFDVILCQNTLHHMPNRTYLLSLLKKMLDIGKKIIIVEIEDPNSTGGFPRLLHNYWYVGFLKDVGEAYLNETDFKNLIDESFKFNCKIKYESFKNIQGKYNIAIIEKSENDVLDSRQEQNIQQIQEKYLVDINIEDFIVFLERNGFSFIKREKEADTYFCDIKGNFISQRICLRTRDNNDNGLIEVLYKDDPYKDKQYVITEGVDFKLSKKYFLNFVNFLEKLNYHKYCTITKSRCEYGFYKNDYICKVSIDAFENQTFIEFMVLTKSNRTRDDLIIFLEGLLTKFKDFNLKRFTSTYRDYYAEKLYKSIVPPTGLSALLVDLDGTLIPSEKVFFDTWSYVCEKDYHCLFTLEEYIDYELRQDHKLLDFLKLVERLDSQVSEKELMRKVYKNYRKTFQKMLYSHDSSPELQVLQELKTKGIKIALVTTSRKEYVDLFLEVYQNYASIFDVIITRFDVENRKPDGEAYEKAALELHVSPEKCLVIEDTPKGIKAAQNANMRAIAVKQHTIISIDDNDNSIPKFDTFTEVVLILNRYLKGDLK